MTTPSDGSRRPLAACDNATFEHPVVWAIAWYVGEPACTCNSRNSAANCASGGTATLERLRVDRQLDEALTHGPDPLHLAAVFGLDDKTAIRYANAARQILETAAETYTHEP